MLATIIIFVVTIISLLAMVIFKPTIMIKNKKIESFWIIASIGAFLMLITKLVTVNEALDSLTTEVGLNPLKLITIFISMSGLSIMLEELGFFKKVANIVLKKAGSSQVRIFIYLYITIAFLTVFTSNDIIILTFTPMICYFAKNAKINPIPLLIGEFVAANTWSLMFIIGNPTNLYLASAINISFIEYFKVMSIPTLITGTFSFVLLFFIFKKSIIKKIEVKDLEETEVKNKFLVISTLIHLAICTILLSIASYINLEMYLICLIFMISAALVIIIYQVFVLKEKPTYFINTLKRVPWNLMPFVISMFIMVIGLNKYGVTSKLENILDINTLFMYGFTSFLSSNFLNNIPMSVMYANVINYIPVTNTNEIYRAIYSSIIGSNIGAYLTPIGALAGIMWMRMLKTEDIDLSFKDFMKYGILIAIPTMLVALLALNLFL